MTNENARIFQWNSLYHISMVIKEMVSNFYPDSATASVLFMLLIYFYKCFL